ncbi:MAG: hypothetical protein E7573_07045 [Ruminococcaceae bacterium]|nr:hypothetical protein [Oscillospiraceae bacterium]
MTGIILAAGDGVRFNDSTGQEGCKALSKINSIHLIEFALNNLVKLNVTEVFIVVGRFGDLIKEVVTDNYKGINIFYVEQPLRKGIINAFMAALTHIKTYNGIILQLADEVFTEFNAEAVKEVLKNAEYDFCCGITFEKNREKIKANFSVETDVGMIIKKCTEKPNVVKNDIKGTGFCVFNNNCLDFLKRIYNEEKNTPYDLCDYMNHLISEGLKGLALCIAQREFNINTLSELIEAENYFAENREAEECIELC